MASTPRQRGRNPGTSAPKPAASAAPPTVPEKLEDRLVWRRDELIKQRDQARITLAAVENAVLEMDALLDPKLYTAHQPQQFAPPEEGTPQQ